MSEPKYFNPDETVRKSCANLPHWHQDGVMTFVTFRLADSLPREFWESWNCRRIEWLATHPGQRTPEEAKEYRESFIRPLQHKLDSGYGSQILLMPEVRTVVEDALRHFHGERLSLDAFFIASNHVHALFAPMPPHAVPELLRSIKGFTGRRILELTEARRRLGEYQPGRLMPHVWQKESFDRLVRSPESLDKFRAYIRAHRVS